MLRINSTWAGTEPAQATRAINSLQARLQLHNFTGCTWEDCKTEQSRRHQQVSSPCLPVSSHWVCSARRSVERSSLFTQPPHACTHRQLCKQPPNSDSKYIFPVCSPNWQLNYSLFNPPVSWGIGHGLGLHWEMAAKFRWRHEEFEQDLPRFLSLVLRNAQSRRPEGVSRLPTLLNLPLYCKP